MAKQRYIDTHFWDDSYIEQLKPIERYLFMYFLTNPHTNICGVYELSRKKIANETSLSLSQIDKIIQKFSDGKKIYYLDGWVYVKNFIRHQSVNPKILLGIENKLKELPEQIIRKINELKAMDSLYIETELPESESKLKLESNSPSEDIPFSEFWDPYPKKVERKKAEEKWNKMPLEHKKKAVADLPLRKQTESWVKGYVLNPMTYLNGERWNDELKSLPAAQPPRKCKECGRDAGKGWVNSRGGVCTDCFANPPNQNGMRILGEMKSGAVKSIPRA